MKKYKVTTKLRDGIKDIEGETIEQELNQNNWPVKNVKVGQVFYLEANHSTAVDVLCKQILVNTLLYDFEIEDVDE
jgi:phosphoribosylformylglycinamidine (FGAM) synthase PurS component|tara:strand:- start:314 stop:541 length:228 start_codon:yes stop_codon:yes gene_type:complete